VTTLAPTLSTRYFPRTAAWLRDLLLIVLGALLVAALAQVTIPLPFTPVPITGQTLAVLLVAAVLVTRWDIWSGSSLQHTLSVCWQNEAWKEAFVPRWFRSW
jgi:hypothetical protein